MNEMFYCRSLNLVSYIISKGIEPDGYNDRGQSLTFYFKKDEKLNKIISSYNSNEELRKFISSFKQVKELVKNSKVKK